MAQGDLPGKSGEQVQAYGADDGKADHVGHIEQIGVGQEGKGQKEQKEQAQPEFHKKRLKNLLVLDIGFLKISASHGFVPIMNGLL